MKYSSSNKPLVCMQTQSTCYKGTKKMSVKGVLWHSTAANNPNLKRYVQPSDVKPSADTYSKSKWLEVLGKNTYNNDWNHIERSAGLNCWIGKLADGTVTTVQTMPWDYKPWGCGSGSRGSCNNGWIQFEICEAALDDKDYFNKAYREACEITAYLCKLYDIDPQGTVEYQGVKVPTILCHQDSYKLGLGGNHSDIYHWFPKHGKDMATVRNDVAALVNASGNRTESSPVVMTYKVVTPVNKYTTAADAKAQKNAKSDKLAVGTYFIYSKYPDGVDGMYNISTDKTGNSAGSWINPKENIITESAPAITLSSIAVAKLPTKIVYAVGEPFDATGLTIEAAYSDKSTKLVTNYTISGFTSVKTGAVSVKVLFEGKTTSFIVTVKEKEIITEPEKPVPVYDLDYPEKTKIVDSSVKRTDLECVKVIKKILNNNSAFDVEIAKAFFKLAPKYRIDPMMAVAQSILETGWFKYIGSAVTAEQHNYCGLGVTSNGIKGSTFDTVEDGVTAQLQHLFAYGCKDALPAEDKVLDPRFSLVTRGIATYWQQLAGRWACPGYDIKAYATPQKAMEAGNTYGQKILTLYKSLANTRVSEEDIEKYFPTNVEGFDRPEAETPTTQEPANPEVIEPGVKDPEYAAPVVSADEQAEEKASGLAALVFNVFKKFIQMLAELFSKGE